MDFKINDIDLQEEIIKQVATRVVEEYFDATDVDDWDNRKRESAKRIRKYVDMAEWEKAPEGFTMEATKRFFGILVEKMK